MLGRHPLKTWSSTQATIATSSAEAELYAMSEGASRGFGLKTILQELGGALSLLVISTDSGAAKAFASTLGPGRMRHMEVKDLWMQALVRDGRLKLANIRGDRNSVDVVTKYFDRVAFTAMAAPRGLPSRPGRRWRPGRGGVLTPPACNTRTL